MLRNRPPAYGVENKIWQRETIYENVTGVFQKQFYQAPNLNLSFINTDTLSSLITFTRASTATFVNSSGLIASAAINAPRFDYNPATLASKGLLLEEARTNFVFQSATFENAAWTKVEASVANNVTTSPDGGTNADKLVESATANIQHFTVQSVFGLADNTSYTVSIFAKPAGRDWLQIAFRNKANVLSRSYFNVQTGVVGTGAFDLKISNAGNGWYRCSATFSSSSGATTPEMRIQTQSADNQTNYNGDGVSGLFLWGAQVEVGTDATSYIPTLTTAIARSADSAVITGTNFSSWFNPIEGTFVVSGATFGAVASSRTFIHVDDTTTTERMMINRNTTSQGSFTVTDNGSSQADIVNGTAVANNATLTAAAAYRVNSFALSTNGAVAGTDSTGTLPTVTQMIIGARPAGANALNGTLTRIEYYPYRLNNEELQALSV